MSDLIKKIKIKKQDGTYTDYIPIGAEAKNVDCLDGESVEYKLNKKPYYYNTVADMKADTSLKVGDMAITLGYYEPNDGGGAEYQIKNKEDVDTIDNCFIIGIYNNIIGKLIINNNTSILQFGAKKDNSMDISSAFKKMNYYCGYVYIPQGKYLLNETITINTYIKIKCEGTINYSGNNYAFIIANSSNSEIEISNFRSTNGGLFSITPNNGNAISFCNFNIKNAYCGREVFYLNANNGVITLLKIDGVRLSNSNGSPIVMYQDNNAISSSFLSEINIFNVDLLSKINEPGIKAICNHDTKSINFNLDNVDLENSWGIHTYGRIFSIGMYNCRMGEINFKEGWLTFNNYMPNMEINGTGDIDLSKIIFNNVPDYGTAKSIHINMNVIDGISGSTYIGGGTLTSRYFIPTNPKYVWWSLQNEGEIINIPESSTSGNMYSYFTLNATSDVTIVIPTQYYLDHFFIRSSNAINLTLNRGSKNCIVPSSISNTGLIKVDLIGGYEIGYSIIKS